MSVPRPRRLSLGPAGWIGGGVLVLMLLACLGTLPWTLDRVDVDPAEGDAAALAPRRYEATRLDLILLPPAWAPHHPDELARIHEYAEGSGETPGYPLGTDRLGRDVLVRCLAGGGISLTIGLAAAAISVVIGTFYGSIAGYAGGRTDAVMMRIVDVLYGLPYILLVVLLAVAVNGLIDRLESAAAGEGETSDFAAFLLRNQEAINVVTLLVAIGAVSWLTMGRVIRGQVLSLKERPFVEAARAAGAGRTWLFTRHLLPNLLGPIVVYATLTVPQAILQESFLSFLGIGVQPPVPSWGNLAAEGLSELNPVRARWWLLVWPCALLGITLLSLNFVGEGLREALDPRRTRRTRALRWAGFRRKPR